MTTEEIQEEYRKCVESFDYWKEHYLMRKRTTEDCHEIVYAMRDEFNQSLSEALETYKQDRQKWVDWYNKKLLNDFKNICNPSSANNMSNILFNNKNIIYVDSKR